MNVPLTYIASSGATYNLKSDGIRTKIANYHKWEWGVNGTALQFGARISDFTKKPSQYETKLIFTGSYSQRKATCDSLHEDFEMDIRNMTPGRVVWGDCYIDCYIISSSTYPNDNDIYTDNDVTIYCPYPFWIQEATNSFLPQEAPAGQTFLDYAYEYDYYFGNPGISIWQTGLPFSSDFKMTIYGAAVNPRVVVNGHPYQVNVTLEQSEYLEIDSRNNTITRYLINGSAVNVFDYRDKAYSVFERIPGGSLNISWSGAFGFDLTLYGERSEPRWV